jgi:hypothetical protein
MRDFEVAFVIDNSTTGPIVIYRAWRRPVLGKAIMLTLAFYIALIAVALAADRPALQRIRYVTDVNAAITANEPMPTCRGWFVIGELPAWLAPAQYESITPPASAPIVPATTCPPGTEMYFSRCRPDCRFGPCLRRRVA